MPGKPVSTLLRHNLAREPALDLIPITGLAKAGQIAALLAIQLATMWKGETDQEIDKLSNRAFEPRECHTH